MRSHRPWFRVVQVGLAALAVILVFGATTASAKPPTVFTFDQTFSSTLTGVCAFDITVNTHIVGTARVFTDPSGNPVHENDQFVETDTFVHNTNVVVSEIHNILHWEYDSQGNLGHLYEVGVIANVLLPDGSVFHSAGRVDFVANNFTFALNPDNGKSGNLAAFCAALA